MNSIKTIVLVALMAAVGYGVYASLNKRPPADPPATLPEDWAAGPQVQLPTAPTTTPPATLLPGSTPAPQFVEATAGTPPGMTAPPPAAALPTTPLPPVDAATPAAMPAPQAIAGESLPPATGAAEGAVQASYPATNLPATPAASPPATPTTAPGGEGVAFVDDRPTAVDAAAVAMPAGGDIHAQFARAFDAAQVQADLGNLAEAHLELSQWYDHPELSEGESRQLVEMLDRLAGTVIYSHKHHLLEPPYEVKPGETLQQIAQQCAVPWQLLAKINGIDDPTAIQPGQKLKVVRGPFDAVVDTTRHRLTLFLQGRYAGRFSIGVGRDMPIQEGDFEVQAIVDNPIYRGPDMVVQAGDPNNPYGRVWIDLGRQMGIHGTNDPKQVGTSGGRGCVFLKPDDMAHVQDILSVGSRVMLRR